MSQITSDTEATRARDGHSPTERQGRMGADLHAREQQEVQNRAAPRPAVVYETIRQEGEQELVRAWPALAWSGLAAGLSMGFSLVAQGLLRRYLPDTPWRPLIVNIGYSIGFIIVIIGRQQLFTENTLTPILPLLNQPTGAKLLQVVRLWSVVLLTNLTGALLFAWIIGHTEVFDRETRDAFTALGQHAMEGGVGTIFLRAIFAGWLIALMVWLLPGAEMARVWIIMLITYLVGLGGLAHIVAGAVEVFYVLTTGAASWSAGLLHVMAPTLVGNIIGGLALVTALNHGQVTAGEGDKPGPMPDAGSADNT